MTGSTSSCRRRRNDRTPDTLPAMATVGTFRALDLTFDVEVEGESTVDVGEVLRDLRIDDPRDEPRRCYRFTFDDTTNDAGELFEDERFVGSGRARVLVDLMVARLTNAIADDERSVAVRATTIELGGTTIVLTGPPRGGKSTLAARLMIEADATLVSEELSLIDPSSLEVRAYHRPLGLTERAFGVLDVSIPPESGEPCGCAGKVLVAPRHLGAGLSEPGKPAVVAWVDHADSELRPMSSAAVLAGVLRTRAMSMHAPQAHLEALVGMLAGARCYAVGSHDLGVASDWILQLARQRPPEQTPTLVEANDGRVDVFAGQEAVVIADDQCHHLNATAAAVWLLRSEGQDATQIADELRMDRAIVDQALGEFEVAGFG